jgi:serine/threonine-protein kinase
MAPEQLEGKEQTARTDIYSLGLVLYELFTSKKAFEAKTLAELIELRRNNTAPTSLSSLVKDLDPVIERVVERCLQTDPALRPSSALQVAAALPGGDPIAAALAAGETPSPEMVAAAPKQGILSPVVAGSLLAGFLVLVALGSWLTKYTAIYRLAPLGDSPEVLRARARDVMKSFGYSEPAIDYADGFVLKIDYLDYIADNDSSPDRWQKMRSIAPGPYRYWYRQSPRYFETIEPLEYNKPALDISGMASLYLGVNGELHWFLGVPPQREQQTGERVNADWAIPFHAAGLDLKNFQPVTSTWVPLHAYDERAAWDGFDTAHPNDKIHVEAAAFRGKLVYFDTIYAWDRSGRQFEPGESGRNKVLTFMLIVITLLSLFGSAVLARRNLRLGRGDRRSAMRVAIVFFVVRMLMWAFSEHHNGVADREFDLFVTHLAFAVFLAAFLWLLYVALEPFVRKKWPGWIISWSRLLAGDYRDPLVGRDLLIGAVAGASLIALLGIGRIAPNWIGQATPVLNTPATPIVNTHLFFSRFAAQLSAGLFLGFICVFLMLLFVTLLRSETLSLIVLGVLITIMGMLISDSSLIMLPFVALSAFVVVFVMRRYGLLALCATCFVAHLYVFYPITTEFTAWYATDFTIALVICVVMSVYAAYTAVGGGKAFAEKLG